MLRKKHWKIYNPWSFNRKTSYKNWWNGEEIKKLWQAHYLSNLVNNLSEELHRIKYKLGYDNKKCETCEIKHK